MRQDSPKNIPPAAVEDAIAVYFSPKGGCTDAIVAINAAKKSIDMQAYYFTSTDIARAPADAKARGVKVRSSSTRATSSGSTARRRSS